MNNPTLSAAPTPSQITTLYRQNVANFLFCCDASLEQNQTPRDCDNITTWIGNTARSISLRAATSIADSDNIDISDNKSSKKRKKELTKISNTRNTKVSAHDVLRLQPSSSWSDNICMACGTLLFPPVMPHTAINANINKEDRKEESSGTNNTMSDNQLQTPNQLLLSQPLPSNIYIRPLKRSRTRRRRASRAKAKELHNRALSIQRRGSSNTNIQLQKEILINEKIQQVASSYRLGDGRAKNCLVMKCTYCGTKKKRKGIEVKADIKKSSSMGSDNNLLKPAKNDTRTKIKGTAQQQQHNNKEKKNVISQIKDNSDYIYLSSISGGSKDNSKGSNNTGKSGKRKQNDDVSPLLTGKKKKKKKKAPEKKKSDLMDFLSSLND